MDNYTSLGTVRVGTQLQGTDTEFFSPRISRNSLGRMVNYLFFTATKHICGAINNVGLLELTQESGLEQNALID